MMKKSLILILVFVLALVGCGGGGSGGGDVIDQFLNAQLDAIRSENLTNLGNTISASYLDDCDTKATVLADWSNIFSSAATITISNVEIDSKIIDEVNGLASASGSFRLKAIGPGGVFETTLSGSFILRRENGVWREIGNQLCF